MSGLIERAVRPLRQRLRNLAARAVLTGCDDSAAPQKVQVEVLAGEIRDLIQRVQQYGFDSVPEVGAYPVVLLCPYGDRTQALAIAVDDLRSRPTGRAPGDVGLYDTRGNRVTLENGVLRIEAAGDLTVQVAGAGTVTISGAASIAVGANATVTVGGNAVVTVTGSATLSTGGALNLGGPGGPAVARVGDAVVGGIITTGSAKVKAV